MLLEQKLIGHNEWKSSYKSILYFLCLDIESPIQ